MESKKTSKFIRIFKIIAVIALAGGIITLFAWQYFNSKNKITQLEEELSYLKGGLKTEITHKLASQDSFYLSLLMQPMSWAIRHELLAGNLETINQYLTQFVKEPEVEKILVIDNEEQIIVSSDKKVEGIPFDEVFPGYSLRNEKPSIQIMDGKVFIVQPVMGFGSRIGSIFCIFSPKTENFVPEALR